MCLSVPLGRAVQRRRLADANVATDRSRVVGKGISIASACDGEPDQVTRLINLFITLRCSVDLTWPRSPTRTGDRCPDRWETPVPLIRPAAQRLDRRVRHGDLAAGSPRSPQWRRTRRHTTLALPEPPMQPKSGGRTSLVIPPAIPCARCRALRACFVTCSFDLKGASSTDYQNAYADLANLGLKTAVVSDRGTNVIAPTTMAMGEIDGTSVDAVRDDIRNKVQAAFRQRRFSSEIFRVVAAGNWTWGGAST